MNWKTKIFELLTWKIGLCLISNIQVSFLFHSTTSSSWENVSFDFVISGFLWYLNFCMTSTTYPHQISEAHKRSTAVGDILHHSVPFSCWKENTFILMLHMPPLYCSMSSPASSHQLHSYSLLFLSSTNSCFKAYLCYWDLSYEKNCNQYLARRLLNR